MTSFLNSDEKYCLKYWGPQISRAASFKSPKQIDQQIGYRLWGLWARNGEDFTDADVRRIAEALIEFRDIYPRRLTDSFIERIIDVAEESGLSAIGVLVCLGNILRTQRNLPSLAHFVDEFDAMAEPAKRIKAIEVEATQRFDQCSDDLRNTLTSKVVTRIRKEIFDFPDVEELSQIWDHVLTVPFGTFRKLAVTETVVPKIINGLTAAEPWITIPLYCMSFAYKLPMNFEDNGLDYFLTNIHRLEDMNAKPLPRPKEWKQLLAQLPYFEVDECLGRNQLANYFEYWLVNPDKEEIRAMWDREKSSAENS